MLLDDKVAPGFLVAPPAMGDANFEHTLVLMTLHDDSGSLGFVVNRPSPVQLHTLLKELEIPALAPDRTVLVGGPVSGASGFVLYEHPAGQPLASGMQVSETLSLTPSKDVLAAAARGELRDRYELLLGYAGWGPGQLVQEIERGSWLHLPFEQRLVFDVDLARRWEEAYRMVGVNPLGFVNVPGGAQA